MIIFDPHFPRQSIQPINPDTLGGTQQNPFSGFVIANNSATGFASLDSSNNVQRMLFMSSGNITYLTNALSDGFVGIASNGGQARWFITGSSNTNDTSTILGNSTINRILCNTSDGADNQTLLLSGGGGDGGPNRGATITLRGNESSLNAGRLELISGSSGTMTFDTGSASQAFFNFTGTASTSLLLLSDDQTLINTKTSAGILRFYIGGAERWQINNTALRFFTSAGLIHANTADGSDNSYLAIGGGGAIGSARGGHAYFYGNEAGSGSVAIVGGNSANSHITLTTTASTGAIKFLTNNTERWQIDQFGRLNSSTSSILFLGDNQTVAYGIEDGISATGSTQADAYAIKRTHTRISNASAGSGLRLPDINSGGHVTVYNTTGTTVKIYPHVGGFINALATDVSYDLAPAEIVYFIRYGVRWAGFKVAV